MKGILLFLMTILPMCTMAQSLNAVSRVNPATKLTIDRSSRHRVMIDGRAMAKKDVVMEDTAYYRDIVRKYQWYEGRGDAITKELAYHLPCYFRLTMKNSAGHWQHVEAMCGDTLTTSHDISHYALDKRFDKTSESNQLWAQRLSTVAQWFLTTGLNQDEVVEERAYDADGNMVYSYLPTRRTNNRIVGCYNDQWGQPIDMNETSQNTYGTVVYIAMDHCGRDSIIDFLDGQGIPKYNTNGVDQQRYAYDDHDRITLSTSHNVVGDRIMDNWGNCGNIFEYNDSINSLTKTTVDTDLKPMQMPDKRADTTRTYIRCHVTFDEYGRMKQQQMLDADNNPSTTLAGIGRIEYHYKEHNGHYIATTFTYYDSNDMPIDLPIVTHGDPL